MKKYTGTIITVIIALGLALTGFLSGMTLDNLQSETLLILLIIAACSALYCFVAGEISGNTSQMDKLWSLLPIVYTWVIAIKGEMKPRLIIIAVIVTLWGARLTFNFARKGAYTLKFWAGREDYRWAVLRSTKPFNNRIIWAIFNLCFISVYQNALVLAMTLPALACMSSEVSLGVTDIITAVVMLSFLIYETIADEQQWKFHQKKKELLGEGRKLEELPAPYNKGFNTTGVWNYSRHPNYLSEQGIWVSLYFFAIGAGVCTWGVFNWSLFGGMFIVLLFLGSSTLGENISMGKYPEYASYVKKVSKYIPFRGYEKRP